MNDAFLSSLRREPPPAFAARLRTALRDTTAAPVQLRHRWPVARIAASVAAVGIVSALLAVPSVRASAASLLARFRVVNFVAIEIDPRRAAQLRSQQLDLPGLIGGDVQVLQPPTEPVATGSPAAAGAAAGFTVRVPSWLPPDVTLRESAYTGPGRLQLVADTTKIEQVLEFLGITDLDVPAGLNGKVTTISVPAVVTLRYANDHGAVVDFVQARSPEVVLPEGVDLAQLAEIGLRVLGFDVAQARQFSRTVDWRSTMLVPIPSGNMRFKHVAINGHPGLSIERLVTVADSGDRPGVQATLSGRGKAVTTTEVQQMVMWSGDGMVFGITGNFRHESVIKMANSAR